MIYLLCSSERPLAAFSREDIAIQKAFSLPEVADFFVVELPLNPSDNELFNVLFSDDINPTPARACEGRGGVDALPC